MEATLRESLIKAAKNFGTPVYVYNKFTIVERCKSLIAAVTFPKKQLLYAMKANSNQAVVRTILGTGFGLDCVSLGEVLFAMQLGAERILYTNNNVADDEFNAVVKLAMETSGRDARGTGKIWINCDSLQRLGDLPE